MLGVVALESTADVLFVTSPVAAAQEDLHRFPNSRGIAKENYVATIGD